MRGHHPHPPGKLCIVRDYHAAVAKRPEILTREETDAAGIPDRATFAPWYDAPSACAVFNDLQSVLTGNGHDGIHLSGLP
jgi:hypothetical protein